MKDRELEHGVERSIKMSMEKRALYLLRWHISAVLKNLVIVCIWGTIIERGRGFVVVKGVKLIR